VEDIPMKLYHIPRSTYSQKVLFAFYEKGVDFTSEILSVKDPKARAGYLAVNPWGKLPSLALPDGTILPESSIIIEYLEQHYPQGTRLIPQDPDQALQARLYDRICDQYLNDTMQVIFWDGQQPPERRNPAAVERARERIEGTYAHLEHRLDRSHFAVGDALSIADCAAAPALNMLRMVHPFDKYKNVTAYWNRLAERPAYARVLSEAAPYLAQMMGQKS
jgi:glutathione S-transferase